MDPIRIYVAGAWDSMLTSGVLAGLIGMDGVDLVGLDLDRLDPIRLREVAPDLLISAGHQYLIAPAEMAVARLGTVGLHPALLPRYRGSHPLWWALHNHETEAGITLYHLDAGIDTGPIIAQRVVPIVPGDTFRSVYQRTVKEIPSLLAELPWRSPRAGSCRRGPSRTSPWPPISVRRRSASFAGASSRGSPDASGGRSGRSGPPSAAHRSDDDRRVARTARRVGSGSSRAEGRDGRLLLPPVGGVAVARTLGSVRYLPAAGWTPVVIAPNGSTYHLIDAAGLATLPAGLEIERARTFEPGHLRRLVAPLRDRTTTPTAQTSAASPALTDATGTTGSAPAPPSRPNAGLTWPARIRRTLWFPDDQLGWIPSALRAVRRAHRRAPLAAIHSSSSPMSAHVAAALAARSLGIPWVADFRDPWVGNPVDPAMGRIDAWRRRTLEAWVIRRADRVTFATPSLHDDYVRRYPGRADRFRVIENGYDRAELPRLPARAASRDGVRRLVYAGSLYRPWELATFLDGVALLLDRRPDTTARLRIEFIGSATDACKAVAGARLARPDMATVVTLTPFLPRAEALRRLADADAALTLLGPGPGMEQFIGAKLYDAIGLDRPVVAMLPPGDARDVLAGLDWGIVLRPGAGVAWPMRSSGSSTPRPPERPADPAGRYDRAALARRLGELLDEICDESAAADRAAT